MIVALGLIVAFVLLLLFSRPALRKCRWRETRGADESLWRCAYCGAETKGARGVPPAVCLRDTR
ncbi:hypothetical protein [Marinovum sp.]|uniref:hypothetical protein n=1 Tax=Marinovum sp. TaxID=2024839 RepID=UPI002B273403|nr:hypothetical protein [Marinovum sp.]